MKILPWAAFGSTLPDDVIENEEGTDFIQYGGKSVAEAIAEILRGLGLQVDAPRNAHERGWELDIKAGKRPLWCQITLIEEYLFVFEDLSFWDKLLKRQNPIYVGALRGLAAALAADQRFHNVRWYETGRDAFDEAGAIAPVIDD